MRSLLPAMRPLVKRRSRRRPRLGPPLQPHPPGYQGWGFKPQPRRLIQPWQHQVVRLDRRRSWLADARQPAALLLLMLVLLVATARSVGHS